MVKNGLIAVSEGANMPSDPDAINIFQDSKVLFGPGKAANAGGVAVSGLEMSQNSMRIKWEREEVFSEKQGDYWGKRVCVWGAPNFENLGSEFWEI